MLRLFGDSIVCFTTLLIVVITFSFATEARLYKNPNSEPEPPSSSFSQFQPPCDLSPNPNDPSQSPSPSPSPSPSQDSEQELVYDVRNYGAVGDGITDDTDSFKTAWDSACSNESNNTLSVLLVPQGFTFIIHSTIFTGPCRSYQYFQVDGTIAPRDGPESWPSGLNKRQWLVFYRINGMALKGTGVIDGRGQKWWDLPCKPHQKVNKTTTLKGPCDSPAALRFFMSSNVTVEGLSIKNSPQFHLTFDGCHAVHINSLRISSPPSSPNTDGIHIDNSKSIEIYNSVISNGDDCVSIGSGSHDIDLRNLTCGPGHGISIGSLGNQNSKACVSNITVKDSVIKSSQNGLRIKTWQGGSGSVSDITFNNIHMDTVRNPIIIDQYYCNTKHCGNKTSAVFVHDVMYQNIIGTYDTRSPPIHFGCSNNVPCTNLTLSNIELLPSKGDKFVDPFCWNAFGIRDEFSVPLISCLKSNPSTLLLSDLIAKC